MTMPGPACKQLDIQASQVGNKLHNKTMLCYCKVCRSGSAQSCACVTRRKQKRTRPARMHCSHHHRYSLAAAATLDTPVQAYCTLRTRQCSPGLCTAAFVHSQPQYPQRFIKACQRKTQLALHSNTALTVTACKHLPAARSSAKLAPHHV